MAWICQQAVDYSTVYPGASVILALVEPCRGRTCLTGSPYAPTQPARFTQQTEREHGEHSEEYFQRYEEEKHSTEFSKHDFHLLIMEEP